MSEFYIMEKVGWNDELGEYSSVEIETGELTLPEVRGRVARLPETTAWLWGVSKYARRDDRDMGRELLGYISADVFEDDVPEH